MTAAFRRAGGFRAGLTRGKAMRPPSVSVPYLMIIGRDQRKQFHRHGFVCHLSFCLIEIIRGSVVGTRTFRLFLSFPLKLRAWAEVQIAGPATIS